MNILQMRQFQIIAKNESITKAAEELFISSPALSKTLKDIEQEFKCNFFDRVGRRIYLNDNGEVFLTYVNNIVNTYDNMTKTFSKNETEQNSSIILCDLGETFLDMPIHAFSKKYPYIQIRKETTSYEKAMEMLLKKEADIIFTDQLNINKHKEELASQKIESTFLFKNNLFLAVSPDSKYAGLKEIDLHQIKNEEFLTIRNEANHHIKTPSFIEHVCKTENIVLNFAHYYDLNYAYKNIYHTPYLHFSDSLHISYYSDSKTFKKYIKIGNPSACQDIYICYITTDSQVSIFADVLKKTFMNIFKVNL
ncbi:MAG: LysR family transcriptional regulator [Eubacteriaceae bacterium]|nr:LysR family transcriptional regulator [Eubacteriaceae bacterium]